MNLEAVGLVKLPAWADDLRPLFWRLRATRPCSTPCVRTWQRRIKAEKARLYQTGIPANEIHMICRILRVSGQDPSAQWRAERRFVQYMARKQS